MWTGSLVIEKLKALSAMLGGAGGMVTGSVNSRPWRSWVHSLNLGQGALVTFDSFNFIMMCSLENDCEPSTPYRSFQRV